MKRIVGAVISVVAVTVLMLIPLSTALADQTYHTQRLPVHVEAAGYPLRNGTVVNIHSNGPVIFGKEQWILNGAKPNATFRLAREFQEKFLGVVPPGTPLDTGFVMRTDSKGNGNVSVAVSPAEVAPVLAWLQSVGQNSIHARLVFIEGGTVQNGAVVGGTLAYATDYAEVTLDQWK
jgi:hypothetical protein